jgi:hypothetical protein
VTKNTAHSVRDRLLKLSKERGEDFNFLLVRYAIERLLHRITRTGHAGEFVLKGAMLFTIWSNLPHRATKDLDLLGFGAPDLERLADIFRKVCVTAVEDDGVSFDPTTVTAARIKEDAEYEGVRVMLTGKLGSAKLAVQVDVGFGDAVTPEPLATDFPTLLASPPIRIRAYPREAVVAEKLHAMVHLGLTNSRMKDFFDIWFLCREFSFDGPSLRDAVVATFERRATPIPIEPPVALTTTFALDAAKQMQWKAFLSRSKAMEANVTLSEVIEGIAPFLLPTLQNEVTGTMPTTWTPGGPWRK